MVILLAHTQRSVVSAYYPHPFSERTLRSFSLCPMSRMQNRMHSFASSFSTFDSFFFFFLGGGVFLAFTKLIAQTPHIHSSGTLKIDYKKTSLLGGGTALLWNFVEFCGILWNFKNSTSTFSFFFFFFFFFFFLYSVTSLYFTAGVTG